jgi:hypothetical protein
MDAEESTGSCAAAAAMATRPLHHPSTMHQGRDHHDNGADNNDESARDLDRRESWKEALRQSCLERARSAKRRRILATTGGAATTSEEAAATPASVSPGLASPMNDASFFFGRNHDQPPVPESASKRRRFACDANVSRSRALLAQRTIHEELMEHGGSGSSCRAPIFSGGGSDASSVRRSQQQQLRGDQQQSATSTSLPSPANSNRLNEEFVMTNEEWLDLLRQVQDELDTDLDGMDETGHGVDLDPEGWSETEEARLLEEARAEQAYWEGMAEEWMAREEEPDLSDDPSGKQSSRSASAGQMTTTSQLEQVEEDVVCPVCQEARLSFVMNECEAAEASGALNATNGCFFGSIVCPNHMDGSCSMRIDNVPLLRSGTSRLGQDGDPTLYVGGQHALETLRRRLSHLSYDHGGSTCTHPLAFEVTDQVLHARCAYCGGSKSVLLASWFPSHRRGCSS